jgi:peptidoglycan-associated lipoprotein
MKLRKMAHTLLLCGAISLLAACTTKHGLNGANGAAGAAGANGAQTSGLNEGQNFGDGSDGMAAGQGSLLAHRTYHFAFDQSEVQPDDRPAVLANADYLVSHPGVKVVIEGHTDPRGSREYNVALGERRAQAVLTLMETRGVNPDQVRLVSYGEERPAVPGYTDADYQMDRRAVIVPQQ